MTVSWKHRLRVVAVLVLAISAAVYLGIVLLSDRDNNACLAIDSSIIDRITNRTTGAELDVVRAAAVENRFAKRRQSVSYETYYIIAIPLTTADGKTETGIWALGTNEPQPESGASLGISESVEEKDWSLAAINETAQASSNLSNQDIPIGPDDPMVSKAMHCL